MGLEFVIELEKDVGLSADIMPTYLFRFSEIFRPIATQKNLIPFEAFLREKSNDWFDPSEGLRTIWGYLDHLRGNRRRYRGTAFIEALELIEKVLAAAERQGVRFYVTTTQALWEAEQEAELGAVLAEDEYQESFEYLIRDSRYHPD